MGIDNLSFEDVQSEMTRTQETAAEIEAKLSLAHSEVITLAATSKWLLFLLCDFLATEMP